jgi:HAD superfamily hydrolase (TIGR01490 family)
MPFPRRTLTATPSAARTRTTKQHKPRRLAVFDIDGTIFRSSLLIECVEALIAAGVFPERARAGYAAAHRRWLDRKGAYEAYIAAVVSVFRRHIVGVAERDFLAIVRKTMRVHRRRVYRYTRDLVATLRERGYFLLAVSQSPKYLVDRFARELGFDKIYGRLLEMNASGRFTGGALFLDVIDKKAKVVHRAVESEGLTLRGSVGVGDTAADIGFLELVERPICFNPNAALCRVASRRGWPVVVERKDVIHCVRPARAPQPRRRR